MFKAKVKQLPIVAKMQLGFLGFLVAIIGFWPQFAFADVVVPAFSVYLGSNQTVTPAVLTQVNFDTKFFDEGSYFSVASSSYTPPAGKYMFSAAVRCSNLAAAASRCVIELFKNGTAINVNTEVTPAGSTFSYSSIFSQLVNISAGDVITVQALNQTDTLFVGGSTATYFSGFQVPATSTISSSVDNPVADLFFGMVLLLSGFFGIVWFFRKRN